jgi:hypothetical protein
MMRLLQAVLCLLPLALCGCSASNSSAKVTDRSDAGTGAAAAAQPKAATSTDAAVAGGYRGFDRNDYPGDATMAGLRSDFTFTGYWITPPPGENTNNWAGKRTLLLQQGWGFLVLANGRLDKEILASGKRSKAPAALAREDAAVAVNAARKEGFPPQTILFLDQEEGGLLLEEQAAYLLAWTEAVTNSGYRAGVYASGQPVPNGPGQTITTIEDIRARVKTGNLHPIAVFDAQDTCPPAPGCTLHAKPLASSGQPDLTAWQYSQSPGRPKLTKSCAATYASDGNCYAPGFPATFLDMDLASSPDPSHGR